MGEVKRSLGWLLLLALGGSSLSCRHGKRGGAPSSSASAQAVATTAPSASGLALTPAATLEPATRVGAALARSPDGKRLYVADEDRKLLHVLALPLAGAPVTSVSLPGAPAQVVALADRVLVTIRHPSLLWIGRIEGDHVSEVARVSLPEDAWGVTMLPRANSALVSSAWSSQLSRVDLDPPHLRWSVPVAREPRGISIAADRAYVSHLVGAELTRVQGLESAPEISRVALPPAPLRTPPGQTLSAALGYAAALSPSEDRLFVARHALGALGKNAWFGAATVDVLLLTQPEEPLAPRRLEPVPSTRSELAQTLISGGDTQVPGASLTPFTQPRAIVLRRSTNTLLVAGEGDDRIAELDALALDPTLAVIRHYQIGTEYHPNIHVAKHGAAPSGLALSEDERTLWVYCRATNEVAQIALADPSAVNPVAAAPVFVELAPDPLGAGGATGRKLFYNASDHLTSGGLACAGCHPDGRDDGFTWHEAAFETEDGNTQNFVGSSANVPKEASLRGFARRTPMLAGRVRAEGPYGWHSESKTVVERILKGFGLHRWGAIPEHEPAALELRATALMDFLRRGLVPPAPLERELDADEQRGKQLFLSDATGCAKCHLPNQEYTTRLAFPLPALPPREGFDDEPNLSFKVPSLYFLRGRAPYLHDGSAASLASLVDHNADRMGATSQLSAAERALLVRFLETL
jgi:mono/diheme cytochrome c family protein